MGNDSKSRAIGASFLWEPVGTREIMAPERFTAEQLEVAHSGREFADKEIFPRLPDIEAKKEGVSLSALLTRGLQHELDARARLEAVVELYGPDGWPTPEERKGVIDSWIARTPKRRAKRKAA